MCKSEKISGCTREFGSPRLPYYILVSTGTKCGGFPGLLSADRGRTFRLLCNPYQIDRPGWDQRPAAPLASRNSS